MVTDKVVNIKEIKTSDFWKHLGNVQNNEGNTVLENVTMYDGSKHKGVVERVTEMINTMRRRKELNEGGTYRALKSLVIPTILYPMKYANRNEETINKLDAKIDCIFPVRSVP